MIICQWQPSKLQNRPALRVDRQVQTFASESAITTRATPDAMADSPAVIVIGDPDPATCAWNKKLEIPLASKTYLPDSKLTINELLEYHFPSPSSTLVWDTDIISHHPPNETADIFITRPIPSNPHLDAIAAALKKVKGSTNVRSIIDWDHKGSYLPLYAFSVWRELAYAYNKRDTWNRACNWLEKQRNRAKCTEVCDSTREILGKMEWGASLRVFGGVSTVNTLATLLSDAWLDDKLIDMFMAHLLDWSKRAKLPSACTVTTLEFSWSILSAYNNLTPTKRSQDILKYFSEKFQKNEITHLFFPAHVDDEHWVAFHLDLEKGLLEYGELG